MVDCWSEATDPTAKGMLLMWGVFAEMERDIISQRVKSGRTTGTKTFGRLLHRMLAGQRVELMSVDKPKHLREETERG